MKNVYVSIIIAVMAIIALMAISIGLYAQAEEKAQGEPKVTLELVHSIDQNQFPAGNKMLREIMQELKSKNIPQEDIDWVLNKTRLDILRKIQILYTKEGKQIKMPYFAYMPHSRNYKYFLLNTCDYADRVATKLQTKLVKTDDGGVVWEIKGKIMAYAIISNDGTVTIEQRKPSRSEGIICRRLDFYNNEGKLVKTIDGLISLPMQYTISDNGNIYTIVTRDDTKCYCNGFDKFGNGLWQTQVPCGHYDDETISFFNNNKYVLYSGCPKGAHTLLIDNSGRVVGHYDLSIKDGTFTNDGKYFVFNVSPDSIHYISIQDAAVHREMVNSGLSPNSEYYFVGLFKESAEEGVIVFDKEGIIQAIHGKGILVSPNKRIIIVSKDIYILEVENE